MMTYKNLPYRGLQAFCRDVYMGYGFTKQESEDITDVILRADLYGFESHGVQRLIRYHKAMLGGSIDKKAEPEILFETPLSAVIDAKNGAGQKMGLFAMRKAIEKAKKTGAGFATMKNANHYGIASYYAMMAAEEELIGFSFSNSEAMMVPTYGKKAMLGSNPIAAAMPAKPCPFSFDAATTVVPRGKLEVYNKQGKELPHGWCVNADGTESTDASDILHNIIHKVGGGIMPLGGSDPLNGSHKGYGYAIICEIFTSILSGGPTSNHWQRGETSQGFIAIDYGMFGDKQEIEKRLSLFLEELRNSDKAQGQSRIYTHGEKEWESAMEKKKSGIPVNEKTEAELKEIAAYLNLDYESYSKD